MLGGATRTPTRTQAGVDIDAEFDVYFESA
jgi:hypothetical protein